MPVIGEKVRVHYALTGRHAGRWSISRGGKVVANADAVVLSDTRTVISEKMRQRVSHPKNCGCSTKCGRRTVHAWIEGTLTAVDCSDETWFRDAVTSLPVVSYNPRRSNSFYFVDDAEPFNASSRVYFHAGAVSVE